MKAFAIAALLCHGTLSAYEVMITDSPMAPEISDPRNFGEAPIEGKTTLIDFLGGEGKIEKIVIGVVANKKHGELTDAVVRSRFAKSVCMDGSKNRWSYAPFAVGTIHFVGGERQSFALLLSGISIDGHLFALPSIHKAEQAGSGQPATRSASDSEGGDNPQL